MNDILTQDDNALILLAAGSSGCSLATAPGDKDNWIERAGGGLPNYVCQVAKGIMKGGKSRSQAIAIAISRIKKWAAGGDDVEADTRAKAAKALAQWEALKAKNKAKKVSLARTDHGDYLLFSNTTSYNTENVRRAWESIQDERRTRDRAVAGADYPVPYSWIKELWTDYIIASVEDRKGEGYVKVPYEVDAEGAVTFGDPSPVKQVWESVDQELTKNEKALLADLNLTAPVDNSVEGRLLQEARDLRA